MNDAELIIQVKNGNDRAFRYLIEQYQNLVLHIVARMIQQNEDVEDVCQEVFFKVFRYIKSFKGDSKLSTWIASIAHNVSLNYLRKHKKLTLSEITAEELAEFKIGQTAQLPDKNLEQKELKDVLMKTIEKLPLQYRSVITLYHLEEFSYKEIEKITQLPVSTIKSNLFRARKMLKEKLDALIN